MNGSIEVFHRRLARIGVAHSNLLIVSKRAVVVVQVLGFLSLIENCGQPDSLVEIGDT